MLHIIHENAVYQLCQVLVPVCGVCKCNRLSRLRSCRRALVVEPILFKLVHKIRILLLVILFLRLGLSQEVILTFLIVLCVVGRLTLIRPALVILCRCLCRVQTIVLASLVVLASRVVPCLVGRISVVLFNDV